MRVRSPNIAVATSLALGVAACSSGADTAGSGGSGATSGSGTSTTASSGGAQASGTTMQASASASSGAGGSSAAGLHASGNQILTADGQPIQLRGVNRSGTEYACIQGFGLFDGASDDASLDAISAWKANAVRVPLNEDCWLAINGVAAMYSGDAYKQAIVDYVTRLEQHGLIAILELHWTAPGSDPATGQHPMPDADHAPAFWADVAQTFKGHPNVIFEPFNEPYPDSNSDTVSAWTCWRDGGSCPGIDYPVAGMQALVDAIRGAGANNFVLLGGVEYSNALSHWLEYEPDDPADNLGAAWHVYNFNICSDEGCFDMEEAPVAAAVPLVATEIGENDCGGDFIDVVMPWLDTHGASYLGWTWNTWGECLVLITDYGGAPNGAYGAAYRDHLLAK